MGFREVLALAPVRRLWIAQIVSVFGDFLAVFGVFAVATFRFKATAVQLGSIIIAFLLPLAVISPVAGVLVDRWDRKRTMIASDLIRAVIAFGLVFATDMRQIYAIFFGLSAVSSFFIPAQSVTLRTLVPVTGLMAANALMQQAIQVVQIVSPAIAGMMVEKFNPNFCYYFDVASFLFSAFMIFGIPVTRQAPPAPKQLRHLVGDLTTGLRFIFTHEAIAFVMISMTVGMFAIRCFGALLAVFVRDVLASNSSMFGILNSLVGVGMILGTQIAPRLAARRSRNESVMAGLLGAGLSILLLAAVPRIATTVAGMLGLGLGVALIFIPAQTLLQEVTPVEMLGRVSSSMMSALAFTQVIAMALSGATAQAIGIRNLYYASAALLVLIAGVGWHSRRPAVAKA